MNVLIKDIATFISADTDWVFGTNMFGGREPTQPANVLTIFDAPGQGRFLFSSRNDNGPGSKPYDYLAFQLRVRSPNYEQAMTQALELVDVLHGIGNIELAGTLYTVIEASDSPFLLEWDEQNRAKIVTNFLAQRTPK